MSVNFDRDGPGLLLDLAYKHLAAVREINECLELLLETRTYFSQNHRLKARIEARINGIMALSGERVIFRVPDDAQVDQ